MQLGCHLSIGKGYLNAAKTIHALGGTAFQYFPKNPRSLKLKVFNENDAEACRKYTLEHSISSVAHTPYPTDLTPPKNKEENVISSLLNDLEIANACGSIGVVVHFGSKMDELNPLEGYKRMIEILNRTLDKWEGECLILIENNAGKSGPMGTTLEEMAQVRNLVEKPEMIGFCLDTCHLFASGVWNGENWCDIEKVGQELSYFDHLKAIHLNNSMYSSGAMKDRHANILTGRISKTSFQSLFSNETLNGIPLILETPQSQKYTHREEIKDVYRLFNQI